MGKAKQYKVGTRGSPLALAQTKLVLEQLTQAGCRDSFDIRVIRTEGDQEPEKQLFGFSNKGIFVRAIEEALLSGEVDFAVHSAKDFPTEISGELVLSAVLTREDPHDVFVGQEGVTLRSLKEQGGRVGTSSFRRQAQLCAYAEKIKCVPLRGNVETRLRKIQTESLEGIVVAQAGLLRLGLEVPYEVIPHEVMLPAVGQGTLVIESRQDREEIYSLVKKIHDADAEACLQAERAFLQVLGGGCHLPAAAMAHVEGTFLRLYAAVFSLDGKRVVQGKREELRNDPKGIGARLAEALVANGARRLLEEGMTFG